MRCFESSTEDFSLRGQPVQPWGREMREGKTYFCVDNPSRVSIDMHVA